MTPPRRPRRPHGSSIPAPVETRPTLEFPRARVLSPIGLDLMRRMHLSAIRLRYCLEPAATLRGCDVSELRPADIAAAQVRVERRLAELVGPGRATAAVALLRAVLATHGPS